MWAKIAAEMQVPWRTAEAMHWRLGEAEMAQRAGITPFSLNIVANETQAATTGPYPCPLPPQIPPPIPPPTRRAPSRFHLAEVPGEVPPEAPYLGEYGQHLRPFPRPF